MPKEIKIAWFDFDSTLNQSRAEGELGYPSLKCLNLMGWMKKKGYKIYILTARKDLDEVRKWCKAFGIETDEITNTKPPADVGFDDRVVTFSDDRKVEAMIEDATEILEGKKPHTSAPRRPSSKAKAFVGRISQ
ncbi:MAG TPA: hypothetical protein VMW38_11780 [Terriglobia bacterium]|nr:hypothetical protein [Terriglobia bacterium]